MLEPSGGSDSSELDQQIAPQEKELINRGEVNVRLLPTLCPRLLVTGGV